MKYTVKLITAKDNGNPVLTKKKFWTRKSNYHPYYEIKGSDYKEKETKTKPDKIIFYPKEDWDAISGAILYDKEEERVVHASFYFIIPQPNTEIVIDVK